MPFQMLHTVAALLVLGGSLPGAPPDVPIQFRKYRDGVDALHSGRFAEALRDLLPGATDLPFPYGGMAIAALAETYSELGDLKNAESMLKASERTGPGTLVAAVRQARVYLGLNRPKQAAARCQSAYTQGIRAGPLAIVRALHAEALMRLNRLPEADATLQQARESLPLGLEVYPWETAWSLVSAARVSAALGRWEEAASLAEQAYRLAEPRWGAQSPLTLAALDEYGTLVARLGDSAKGRAILERVLALRRQIYPAASPSIRSTQDRLDALPK